MADTTGTRTVKDEVLEMIQRLPDNCSLEDIHYHLYVREMVAEGILDVEQGKSIPDKEARRRMKEWLKSRGLQKP